MQDSTTALRDAPFQQIIHWSKGLPLWQQDAVRRIVESGNVEDSDVEELVQLCLKENGLKENSDLSSSPIQELCLPVASEQSDPVTLTSISEIENANALDSKQCLTFAESGLTVVFGNNGSGKSGYGKILRRACRSRSRGEPILPNVMKSHDGLPASAVISYCLNGSQPLHEQWIDGQRAIDALGSVSFFDAECALEHVRSKNDIAFTPFGLDILPKLGNACKRVQSKLDLYRQQLKAAAPKFLESICATGNHAVGKILSKLSADTDVAAVELLSNLSELELKRIDEIGKLLEADPNKEAKSLRKQIDSIAQLLKSLKSAGLLLSCASYESLKQLVDDSDAKKQAADLAALTNFADDPLKGVGTAAWKQLWQAARQFSQVSHPKSEFPPIGDQAVCLLCQQELGDIAKDRFARFERFVSDQTAKAAKEASEKHENQLKLYNNFVLDSEPVNLLIAGVEDCSASHHQELVNWVSALRTRKQSFLEAVNKNVWPEIQELDLTAVVSGLETLTVQLRISAEKFDQLARSAERTLLLTELEELRARQWLSTVLNDVKLDVVRHIRMKQLSACITESRTNKITAKSKELAKVFVTDHLRNAFADEIKKMHQGTRRLNVELTPTSGEFGSSNYRVQLIGATSSDIGMVVSEGEHRCIALAGFLSELATEKEKSAIIFDDPVTSLDHVWRECFATRLIEEASCRQVIVFTHDIVFLHDLLTGTDRAGVPCQIRYLSADATTCGRVSEDLPWIGKRVLERIDELEKATRSAQDLYDSHRDTEYNEKIRQIYGKLRATIERTIEEIFFQGVVIRHRDYVNVKNLKIVAAIETIDCNDLMDLFQKCCDQTDAHDPASSRGFSVPNPLATLGDIAELRRIVDGIKAKQKAIAQAV